jgi:hypothetical protein
MASALHTRALEDFQNSCFQPRGTKLHSSRVLAPYCRMFVIAVYLQSVLLSLCMLSGRVCTFCEYEQTMLGLSDCGLHIVVYKFAENKTSVLTDSGII